MKKAISNICKFFKKYKEYFVSFLFGFILILAIFLVQGLWYRDKSMILSDAFAQYYELFYYLREVLNGTKSIFYTFQIGSGTGMFATMAYYLISPFNILVLLFDVNHLQLAMHLIIMLKIAMTVLTMYILLRSEHKKMNYWLLLAFSLCYGLSDFMLGYEFDFIWFDALYLLPLVVLGINKIVDQKKPTLYLVTLFLTIMCNYYIGYMVCIFSLLYFVYRIFITYNTKNDKKLMLKTTSRYIMSTLFAGFATFFVMYPTLDAMKEIGRANASNITTIDFFGLNMISKMFIAVSDSEVLNRSNAFLYCGLSIIMLTIIYFFNKGINKKERLLSLGLLSFLILSLFFKPLYYMWHAFSTPSSFAARFSFLIIFFSILLSVKEFENIEKSKIKEYLISALFIVLLSLYFIIYPISYLDYGSVYGTAFGCIFYLVLLYLYKKEKNEKDKKSFEKMFIFLVVAELFFNAYVLYNAINKNSYLQVDEYSTILSNGFSQINDDSFYRIGDTNTTSMLSGLVTKNNTASLFLSTSSSHYLNFTFKIGYNSYVNAFKYKNSATQLTDVMLNVKYVATDGENYKGYTKIGKYKYSISGGIYYNVSYNDYNISRNDSTFGIATMTSSKALTSSYTNDMEYQNLIFKTMTGIDKDIYEKINFSSTADCTYNFINPDAKYYYLDLPKISNYKQEKVYINGELIADRNSDEQKFYDDEIIVIPNEHEVGSKLNIKVTINDQNAYANETIYTFNKDIFDEGVKIMQSNAMTNVEWKDNGYLKGTVKSTDDFGVLYVSIPYEKGWTAYVDGNKTDIKEIYNGMMSLSLTPGEHTVEFKYQTPGLLVGTLITLISLIVYILYYRYRNFVDNLFSNIVIKCSKVIFEVIERILFIIISLIVYILFFTYLKLPALSCVTIAWLFVIAYKYIVNRNKKHKDFDSIVKDILLCVKEDGVILILELYLMYKLVNNFGESYTIYLMSVIFANLIIFLIKKILYTGN